MEFSNLNRGQMWRGIASFVQDLVKSAKQGQMCILLRNSNFLERYLLMLIRSPKSSFARNCFKDLAFLFISECFLSWILSIAHPILSRYYSDI